MFSKPLGRETSSDYVLDENDNPLGEVILEMASRKSFLLGYIVLHV
jgi:hypothetical protein